MGFFGGPEKVHVTEDVYVAFRAAFHNGIVYLNSIQERIDGVNKDIENYESWSHVTGSTSRVELYRYRNDLQRILDKMRRGESIVIMWDGNTLTYRP